VHNQHILSLTLRRSECRRHPPDHIESHRAPQLDSAIVRCDDSAELHCLESKLSGFVEYVRRESTPYPTARRIGVNHPGCIRDMVSEAGLGRT